MIVTVLWEDQLGVTVKGFGPHELLVSCVADDRGVDRATLKGRINPVPKKGNANVRKALQNDLVGLVKSGRVFAVVDWDRVHDLLGQPKGCKSVVLSCFHQSAPGDYELLFLVHNVETLVRETCVATKSDTPKGKNPNERDKILQNAAWGDANARIAIRAACPSFNRLVKRVSASLG